MKNAFRPTWQLPPGVSRGAWDYVNEHSIAGDYDSFHGQHPLMSLDQELIQKRLSVFECNPGSPRTFIDLGCGTGRAILPWRDRGWRTIGVDLSLDMLGEVARKSGGPDEKTSLIHANLAQLDFFQDSIADAAVCLYSSIGMIRGHEHRLAMFRTTARLLKPGGVFVLHVHNRGNWFTFPNGVRMWFYSWWQSKRDSASELGDRIYPYRGLPSMFLHIYSLRELRRSLLEAGFKIETIRSLNRTSSGYLKNAWFLPNIRAGGFIATAII
jgi:ubiquinone/menaquinone biosynthesis C-methylase UbiE